MGFALMSISKFTISTMGLLCMSFFLAACSKDEHTYYSSPTLPTNVTVFDTLGDKPLWIKEIPVGKTLKIDFDRLNENEWQRVSGKPATQFSWSLYDDTNEDPIASDEVALPGTPVRLKVSYRPSPEYPTD